MARTGKDHNITRNAEFNAEGQANKSCTGSPVAAYERWDDFALPNDLH